MIIFNSIWLYVLILLFSGAVISSLCKLNVKIMLWVFLVTFNVLFVICMHDYYKTNFLFVSSPSEISWIKIIFLSQTYTLHVILLILNDVKDNIWYLLQFIYLFRNLFTTYDNLILTINTHLSFIISSSLYSIVVLLQACLITFLQLIKSILVLKVESGIYNWEGTFNSYNSVNFNTSSLNYITTVQHLFLLLTIFLTPFALFSNWNDLRYKILNIKMFLITLIALDLLLIICFSTFNLFLFILAFEATTLPLFLLIGLFGHRSKKFRAAWYLFIYTLLGSVFMLGSVILIYYQYKTVNLVEICFNYQFSNISFERFKLIWIGLFLGFAIKVPIAPFHMWLPEAHVEAPTAGSILLAGILLKLGGFGIIFFMLPFFNNNFFLPLVYTLCIISMFYSSFILFRETHIKKIIAYSSIVHMNIGILGLFSNSTIGIMGGVFMMFSHAFISGGLFYCGGIIFNRFKSYDITTIKNLSNSMPKFSLFLILLIFGNMGLPLTSGFIGEFLVLFGTIQHNYFVTLCLLLTLLFNTIYNIILLTRVLYGNLLLPSTFTNNFILKAKILYKPGWKLLTNTQDIGRLEYFSLLNLTFYSIFFGLFPNFFLIPFLMDNYLFLLQ